MSDREGRSELLKVLGLGILLDLHGKDTDKDYLTNVEFEQLTTDLPWGGWVSTSYLRVNLQHDDGPSLWFETMVFPSHGNWLDLDMDRYSTREEAIKGHAAMVEKWQGVPNA